jgi:hypothetical protein
MELESLENAWNGKLVPRSEFTELGLWYRRRALVAGTIFVLWSFVLMVANAMASAIDTNDIGIGECANFRSGHEPTQLFSNLKGRDAES